MNNYKFDIVHSLSGIKAEDWNSLNNGHTVTSYEFLAALEETQNVGEQSGWLPSHLIATSSERLVGAVPLYIKTHSYGEYIFDWAWADRFSQPVALLFHQVGAGGRIDLSLQWIPLARPPRIPVDSKEQRINSPMITRLDISEFPP